MSPLFEKIENAWKQCKLQAASNIYDFLNETWKFLLIRSQSDILFKKKLLLFQNHTQSESEL